MTDKLPWMPFYGADFYESESVRLMTPTEEAIYIRLLWHQWREGSVPAMPIELKRLVGHKVPPRVLAMFPIGQDERRRNPRMQTVWQEQAAVREVRAMAGSLGGKAKAKAQQTTSKTLANGQQKPRDKEPETDNNNHSRKRARRSADKLEGPVLPEGYLDAVSREWETNRGIPNHGLLGKVHKPLVAEHGPRQVLLAWVGYIADRTGKDFCHPVDFATNYEIYRQKWAVEISEEGTSIPVPDEPVAA